MIATRLATDRDRDAIHTLLAPVVAAGETLALPRDGRRDTVQAYWFKPGGWTYVAEDSGRIVGSYYLRPNQQGGRAHVANAGYVVAADFGGRGVGRAMGADSLVRAREAGFTAMQFNFVVANNVRAVALWQSLGFAIVGQLPGAFIHPVAGAVDALVMFRSLDAD